MRKSVLICERVFGISPEMLVYLRVRYLSFEFEDGRWEDSADKVGDVGERE